MRHPAAVCLLTAALAVTSILMPACGHLITQQTAGGTWQSIPAFTQQSPGWDAPVASATMHTAEFHDQYTVQEHGPFNLGTQTLRLKWNTKMTWQTQWDPATHVYKVESAIAIYAPAADPHASPFFFTAHLSKPAIVTYNGHQVHRYQATLSFARSTDGLPVESDNTTYFPSGNDLGHVIFMIELASDGGVEYTQLSADFIGPCIRNQWDTDLTLDRDFVQEEVDGKRAFTIPGQPLASQ